MTNSLRKQCDEILELEIKRLKSTDEEEIKKIEKEIEKKTMMIGISNINHLNQVDNYLFPKLMKIQEEIENERNNKK